MCRISDRPWVIIFIGLLFYQVPFNEVFASVDGKLELWFEYDGHQVSFNTTPTIKCIRKTNSTPVVCNLYQSEDGRYWIDKPPGGEYLIEVEFRGDNRYFYRQYPFTIKPATTGPLLIAINRVLSLQEAGRQTPIPVVPAGGCREYQRYEVPILTLFQLAELHFNWQPLAEADAYYYRVWRMRCADGLRIEPVRMGKVEENAFVESVPRNEAGEYYTLELIARHGSQDIGQLLVRNENTSEQNGYPFVVIDPLGSRSWYPYLILALLSPLVLWLLWRMLLGIASYKPGRGLAWLATTSLLVFAGYQFRHDLLSISAQGKRWSQQNVGFDQKWYRNQAGKEAYTEKQDFGDGSWSGYLVASGSKPFVGAKRRLGLRIEFSAHTAKVSLLLNGQWQRVGEDDFTLRRSGSGMTLFGHSRNAQGRELWMISIADNEAPILNLVLDRMITRREVNSDRVISERRQATGELRHSFP
jgi:hypothetical protein